MYDEELAILEKDTFVSEFYELLTFKIRFLLIDEFQDTSVVQFKLLQPIINELLSGFGQKDYGDVVVVGDEKTSHIFLARRRLQITKKLKFHLSKQFFAGTKYFL